MAQNSHFFRFFFFLATHVDLGDLTLQVVERLRALFDQPQRRRRRGGEVGRAVGVGTQRGAGDHVLERAGPGVALGQRSCRPDDGNQARAKRQVSGIASDYTRQSQHSHSTVTAQSQSQSQHSHSTVIASDCTHQSGGGKRRVQSSAHHTARGGERESVCGGGVELKVKS